MEESSPRGAQDPGISGLKRSILRNVADLELHKADADRLAHAAEVAAALARAGRPAYVVDPVDARQALSGRAAEFATEPQLLAEADPNSEALTQ